MRFSTSALLLVLAGVLWPGKTAAAAISNNLDTSSAQQLHSSLLSSPRDTAVFRVPGSASHLAAALDRVKRSTSLISVDNDNMSIANPLMATAVEAAPRRPEDCPPCFNCLLDAFPCSHFAPCNAYDGRCTCPPGFAGDNCSVPGQ
jgi:hypothetical protein